MINNINNVSDFGLSRGGEYYDSQGSKFPVKWTAVEIFKGQPFTTASDCWSFGVVCWEVLENGDQPFAWMSNLEAMEKVKGMLAEVFLTYTEGERLPMPKDCPPEMWNLILSCWNEDPKTRPTFSELAEMLKTIRNSLAAENGSDSSGIFPSNSVAYQMTPSSNRETKYL